MAFLIGLALWAQGTGLPELPPPLSEDAQVVTAWEEGRLSSDAEVQRTAAALILERLPAAAPAAQFDFLLACAGGGLLDADLAPDLRRVHRAWEGSATRLAEVLALPPERETTLVRGALRAAGHLELADPPLVEALAGFLADPRLQADARASLLRITGREFADWEAFRAWWSEAHDLGREAWLSRSLQELRQRELEQWRRRLERSPASALEAVDSERAEVRRLAYAALPAMLNGADDASLEPVRQRLRRAYHEERVASLRIAVLGLVPLFFRGEEAVEMLHQALDARDEEVRVQAAKQLQLVNPAAAPLEVVRQRLRQCYPEDGALDGSPRLRQALWNSLRVLAAEAGIDATGASDLQPLLLDALAREPEAPVRANIFTAAGSLGGLALMEQLRERAMDPTGDTADRVASLKAYTRVAMRLDPGRAGFDMEALLADPDETVRSQAIASVQELGEAEDVDAVQGAELLAARLPLEQQGGILRRLLRALADETTGNGAVLELLLQYEPQQGMAEEYRRAVRAHVGGDLADLQRAVEVLAGRGAWETGYRLVAGFDRASLEADDVDVLDRMHARMLAEWLIATGVENGAANLAVDAVGRLQELAGREPESVRWARLLTELQLMRGEVDAALAAFEPLLEVEDLPADRRFGLGLRCVNAAVSAGRLEEARALFEALGEPPETYREFHRSTEERLPAAPEPEPAPGGDGEEGETEGEVAEDGGEESDPTGEAGPRMLLHVPSRPPGEPALELPG